MISYFGGEYDDPAGATELGVENLQISGVWNSKSMKTPENRHLEMLRYKAFAALRFDMGRFPVPPVFGCFEKQIPKLRVIKIQLFTTWKKHPKFGCVDRVVEYVN